MNNLWQDISQFSLIAFTSDNQRLVAGVKASLDVVIKKLSHVPTALVCHAPSMHI